MGASVNSVDGARWTPLQCALYSGHMHIAGLLVPEGADLDVHTAAALGRTDVIATLLRVRPAFARSRDGALGGTPLHWAARGGQLQTARLLLDSGADARARDSRGETPLAWAVGADRTEAAELLRQHLAGQ